MSGVATKIGQWADFTDQPLYFQFYKKRFYRIKSDDIQHWPIE